MHHLGLYHTGLYHVKRKNCSQHDMAVDRAEGLGADKIRAEE
jgi:hypothetical protein